MKNQFPSELKILDWGTTRVNDGSKLTLNKKSGDSILQNQRRLGRGRIAIDLNHCTVPHHTAYKRTKKDRRVYAYGDPKVIDRKGLYLVNLSWTDWGKRQHPGVADIAPVLFLDNGKIVGLHSAALVRPGATALIHPCGI